MIQTAPYPVRNLLSPGTADSSRDKAALRNDKLFRQTSLGPYQALTDTGNRRRSKKQ
jgi:hypothetical protein